MSYANGTAHYNLPQTVGTDKRDWADTNEAFAAIDAACYTASETAASSASGIAALATTVANLSNAQVTLQHDVDELTITVSSQGTSIVNLGNKIDDVEDDCLDMICAVDEGTAQVATVAVEKDEYFRYNNVLYIATADIAIGDTIVPNTNCKATNIATELEDIAGSITTPTASDVALSPITGMTATNVQAGISELHGTLTDTDYVEVTADGVKTYGALLNELYALIDSSKITKESCVKLVVNNEITYLHITNSGADYYSAMSFSTSNSGLLLGTITIKSSGSTYTGSYVAAGTYVLDDYSSNVASAGKKIKFVY